LATPQDSSPVWNGMHLTFSDHGHRPERVDTFVQRTVRDFRSILLSKENGHRRSKLQFEELHPELLQQHEQLFPPAIDLRNGKKRQRSNHHASESSQRKVRQWASQWSDQGSCLYEIEVFRRFLAHQARYLQTERDFRHSPDGDNQTDDLRRWKRKQGWKLNQLL